MKLSLAVFTDITKEQLCWVRGPGMSRNVGGFAASCVLAVADTKRERLKSRENPITSGRFIVKNKNILNFPLLGICYFCTYTSFIISARI